MKYNIQREIICILMIFSFTALHAIPQRYEKIYDEKYSANPDVELFKKSSKSIDKTRTFFYNVIEDEFIYENFESERIRYILIENFSDPYGIPYGRIYYEGPKDLEIPKNERLGLSTMELTKVEFDDFFKLISAAVKDEVMTNIGKFVKNSAMTDAKIIVTYFDGKSQRTAYFILPEESLRENAYKDNAKDHKLELTAARNLMYAWRYGTLNHLTPKHVLTSASIAWLVDNKEILDRLDKEMKEALAEKLVQEKSLNENKTDNKPVRE